ncbi:nuclear transport factor 2 family protein [Kitasatospora mediocidica]|uniref:nuclear transport factor 2 family protein n=1 Tax=Kitasatospora mediocidica TaxID=58352 RepID=UPI00056CB77C|nr:nuclear transport factor 2 family protein [Kitasatospora mediocidica]
MTSPTVPHPLDRLLAAVNAGELDAFLDFFTDDGVVDDWGREFRGRAAIQGWSDREFLGSAVTLKVTGVAQNGAEVVVSTEVGGNGFNGPSDFAFQVDGDRVRRMRITG